MRNIQIETKVLEIVDQIREDRPIEDATVELKAEWPTDIPKASRQLAGHANAARGEEILWIIGIDEKNRAIPGANKVELANWIPQIESRFDDIAPNLSEDLLVPLETGKSVVALLFETDQAPYVVKYHKDPNFLEVPWRQGTRVRSAKRAELVSLLLPMINLPQFEIVSARADVQQKTDRTCIDLTLDLYNTTRPEEWITIPFHKCSASLRILGEEKQIDFDDLTITPQSDLIVKSRNELMIGGPGALRVQLHTHAELDKDTQEQPVMTLRLLPVGASSPVTVEGKLELVFPDDSNGHGC